MALLLIVLQWLILLHTEGTENLPATIIMNIDDNIKGIYKTLISNFVSECVYRFGMAKNLIDC